MNTPEATTPKFAICVQVDEQSLLTVRKIYPVVPDEGAAKSNYIRVVDDEGEDYLYPCQYFVLVNFSPDVEQALFATV